MSMLPDLLTTREVAKHLAVTTATIRSWVRCGRIEPAGRTLAGHFRFTREAVAAAIGQDEHRARQDRARCMEAHVAASMERMRRKMAG